MTRVKPSDLELHLGAIERMGLLVELDKIASAHHVAFETVLSHVKSKRVMQARLACYLYLRGLEMSYPEIGKVMLRDHSSVIHAVKRYKIRKGENGRGGNAGGGSTPAGTAA